MKLIKNPDQAKFNVCGLDAGELEDLKVMIEGAALPQRRVFNPLLEQIKEMGL